MLALDIRSDVGSNLYTAYGVLVLGYYLWR